MRIASLLPSATEIVCGLGLRESLVGVTHECDYPPSVNELPKLTRSFISTTATSAGIDAVVRERVATQSALYSLDMDVLRSVEPDLIITQSLCDVCAVAESEVNEAICTLPNRPRVLNLEPTCLDDVFDSISKVGTAAGHDSDAQAFLAAQKGRVQAVAKRSQTMRHHPRVLLLEWIDPPFSAGHWNPELIELAGGRVAIGRAGGRSTTVPWHQIVSVDPEVLLIACCGFDIERTLQDIPILQAYDGWRDLQCVQSNRVFVADGSALFNRPGPRLVDSLEILANAVAPEIHPLHDGMQRAINLA